MTAKTALLQGARQLRGQPGLVALFYLVNLAAAAAIVAPLAVLIGGPLEHSLESDRLFANFDPAWLAENFDRFHSQPFMAMTAAGVLIGLLYLVASTFFAGGAIAMLDRPDRTFFSSCARLFWRLLRLMLLSLVCYGVVLAVGGGLGRLIEHARESSMQAKPWSILHWSRLLLEFLLLGFVNMAFDYGRIACVVQGTGAWRGALRGFRFAFRNLGRTLMVYWTLVVAGLVLLALYHGLSELAGQASIAAVVGVFVLRQLFMIGRMWLRLWTWSSEVRLYTAPGPPVSVAPAPADEAPEPVGTVLEPQP